MKNCAKNNNNRKFWNFKKLEIPLLQVCFKFLIIFYSFTEIIYFLTVNYSDARDTYDNYTKNS